jgi:eukaryotic-like serine/threonine-protein kinase
MSITAPELKDVKAAFPSIKDIVYLDVGGYKAVYKIALGSKTEALKIIEMHTTAGASQEEKEKERTELRARIHREVSVLAEINIPELVKLGEIKLAPINVGSKEYLAYSEEFVAGKDLMKLINAKGDLPDENDLRLLLLALLKAIRVLWSKGIIHRDIKPANIMKTNDPKRPFILMDLGIAFVVDETGITSNTAAIPATIKYIAPEMLFRGFRNTIDWRSDLYSAGLSVYEYAAFKHPLARGSDDPGTTLYNALKKTPKYLKELRQDLNGKFCALIDQMLKKKQALRPPNIELLIKNLEAGL